MNLSKEYEEARNLSLFYDAGLITTSELRENAVVWLGAEGFNGEVGSHQPEVTTRCKSCGSSDFKEHRCVYCRSFSS